MKVIDLLNKIANGEEVPKEIKFKTFIYKFIEAENRYYEEDNIDQSNGTLGHYWALDGVLNEEVEIIEENKKIEKIDLFTLYEEDMEKKEILQTNFRDIKEKINEILDKLNEGE